MIVQLDSVFAWIVVGEDIPESKPCWRNGHKRESDNLVEE
jgi:hypothetical protein